MVDNFRLQITNEQSYIQADSNFSSPRSDRRPRITGILSLEGVATSLGCCFPFPQGRKPLLNSAPGHLVMESVVFELMSGKQLLSCGSYNVTCTSDTDKCSFRDAVGIHKFCHQETSLQIPPPLATFYGQP